MDLFGKSDVYNTLLVIPGTWQTCDRGYTFLLQQLKQYILVHWLKPGRGTQNSGSTAAQTQQAFNSSITPCPCGGQFFSRQEDRWASLWGLSAACCVQLPGGVRVGGRALPTRRLPSRSLTSYSASTLMGREPGNVRPVRAAAPWLLLGALEAGACLHPNPLVHAGNAQMLCERTVPLVLGHQEPTVLHGPLRFCGLLGTAR